MQTEMKEFEQTEASGSETKTGPGPEQSVEGGNPVNQDRKDDLLRRVDEINEEKTVK